MREVLSSSATAGTLQTLQQRAKEGGMQQEARKVVKGQRILVLVTDNAASQIATQVRRVVWDPHRL